MILSEKTTFLNIEQNMHIVYKIGILLGHMTGERDRGENVDVQQRINVEFVAKGELLLTFPNGTSMTLEVPKKAPEGISRKVLMALAVSKLAIPITFPEELGGVDQAGFQTAREDDIQGLPGGREQHYKDALQWSGAVLQGNGWSAERVANC